MRDIMQPVRLASLFFAGVLCVTPGSSRAQSSASPEPKRPTLTLKATPSSGTVPMRVFLSVELKGGEVLTLGETKLKFVPFCGKDFDWQSK